MLAADDPAVAFLPWTAAAPGHSLVAPRGQATDLVDAAGAGRERDSPRPSPTQAGSADNGWVGVTAGPDGERRGVETEEHGRGRGGRRREPASPRTSLGPG